MPKLHFNWSRYNKETTNTMVIDSDFMYHMSMIDNKKANKLHNQLQKEEHDNITAELVEGGEYVRIY